MATKEFFSTNSTGTWSDEMMDRARATVDKQSDKSPMSRRDGIDTWRYPIYIDNFNEDNDAPRVMECIHFTAMKQGGVTFEDPALAAASIAALANQQDNTISKMTSDTGASNARIKKMAGGLGVSGAYNWATDKSNAPAIKKMQEANALSNQTSGENNERSGIEWLKEQAGKALKFAKVHKKGMSAEEKPIAHCFLYMPASVQEGLGASWGVESLGALGQGVREGLRGGKVDDIIKNFTGSAAGDIGKSVALAMGAGAGALLAKNALLGLIGAGALLGGAAEGFQSAARLTKNPFEEQIFNGIGYRDFAFDFVFQPSSEAEGIQIAEIIKMFRLNSRPNFAQGPFGEGLYTFPNEFAIEFMSSSGSGGDFFRNTNLPKIYNCVCTNVATNFTPEGFWTSMKGGVPVAYGLSLTFTETKKITQDDVKGGW